MLVVNDTLLLCVECLPLVLEHVLAYGLVLANALWVELSTTALATFHELGGIVLYDLHSVLFVHFLYACVLEHVMHFAIAAMVGITLLYTIIYALLSLPTVRGLSGGSFWRQVVVTLLV